MTAQPPFDRRAEMGYIGTLMMAGYDPAYQSLIDDMLAVVRSDDCYDDAHVTLVEHIRNLHANAKIDPTLLVDRLKVAGDYEAVGGSAYLSKIINSVPNVANGMYYAEIIRDHRRRRDLQTAALQLLEAGEHIDLALADQLLRSCLDAETSNRGVVFRAMTGTQLAAASFTTTYLVQDVYVERQPLIFGGGKKNLKTNSLLDFGISGTTGSPFLGQFAVNRRFRVAIMTGESGEATVKESCERIARAKGVDLNDDLIISPDLPRIEEPAHQRALRRFIRDWKPEVIAIDPAYLCMSGDDASSVFKNGNILRTLAEICREESAGLILAHHTKKKSSGKGGDMFAPPELEDLSWAGFQEFARQWVLFSRSQKYDPEQAGHHELWMSIGGSAGHSSLWAVTIDEGSPKDAGGRRWDVAVNTPSDARQTAQQQQEEAKQAKQSEAHRSKVEKAKDGITNALRTMPNNSGSKSSIQDRAGMKGNAFDDALGIMLREGKLVECEITLSNKQKYPGFRYVFQH
ncbi:DnaB-like helicase N-terminal domain-containing protein [Anatilimnocola sp. NA78]|uniref:DnaB-like helicase N-terminal domain-containing protein n=1 Tax=Anatilimnocola sp. NA78 TaxID=3415683 RepID=UPI003CE4B30E